MTSSLSRSLAAWLAASLAAGSLFAAPATKHPNIVLIMADDLGWGDVAYNGNPRVRTPHLDQLARDGVRLDRFYAGGPVCTPTRATCLTGRNPNRYGTEWAGDYPLPTEEITLAELFRDAGYRTGHFGKWHLGKLTPDSKEGFAEKPKPYMAPWHQGFQTCFSVESATPNYNPAVWGKKWDLFSNNPNANKYVADEDLTYGQGTLLGPPGSAWPFRFWLGDNRPATDTIAGDSSELIVNHALPFIEEAVQRQEPFLAVIWFVTPHTPVAAGPEYRALYPKLSPREQHWFGAITAMDAQIGRVLETLAALHVADDTIVWFCSDNGPTWVHELASAGPFRGQKSELYEGGIRVPGIVRWPAGLKGNAVTDLPMSTLDFVPTLLAACAVHPARLFPLDGENVLPLLRHEQPARDHPLFFDYPARETGGISWVPTKRRQSAVMSGAWKLVSFDDRQTFELYNLHDDPGEKINVAGAHAPEVTALRKSLAEWTASCQLSRAGQDYH
jgi:arylsulfatase A-like enzyme